MPPLAQLLERVDHWLARGWPAMKLRGRARDQFRGALAELQVADHFEARGFGVASGEAAAGGARAADIVVAGDVRAVVEVYSPVEWEGLEAFQEDGWDTLRNLDLPFAYLFSFDVKQRKPIGERGYVPLHPELLARALARSETRQRVFRPLVDEVGAKLAGEPAAVAARHEDVELDLVIDVELEGVRRVESYLSRGGSWGLDGLGGYRPEAMFDGIVDRIANKANEQQARSDDAIEVVVADMSRVQLESELVHGGYRRRFADALNDKFGDVSRMPCDIVALCASRGWTREVMTYFLIARDAAALTAAESLFGALTSLE
jgi:hypothetical protein